MEETKKQRGGKRDGAGRKKSVSNVRTVAIRVPQDIADILDQQESITQFICDAIREKAQK